MSKNKTIKYMHDTTGLSYKECRKRLKENKWDLLRAMGYGEALEMLSKFTQELSKSLASAVNAMVDATKKIAQSIADTINSIDLTAVIEEAKKIKEVDNNEGEFTNGNDS